MATKGVKLSNKDKIRLDQKTAQFVVLCDKYFSTPRYMIARRWALRKTIKQFLYGTEK